MEVVRRWSKRIAQRVASEEVDFAAEVGVAYAAGGRKRKGLLPRSSTQPGAFGPGNYAVDLPLILRALADAGDAILWLLRSTYLGNVTAIVGLLVALRTGHRDGQTSGSERPAVRTATGPEPPPALRECEKEAVERAFLSLRGRLVSAGFGQERAGKLAVELLEELLTDAAEAALFVEALSARRARRWCGLKSSAKAKGKRARRNSRS